MSASNLIGRYAGAWLSASFFIVLYYLYSSWGLGDVSLALKQILYPLVAVLLIYALHSIVMKWFSSFDKWYSLFFPLLLFFSISLTSLFGWTETLTGSHAESEFLVLFGLSFYTATLAYQIRRKEIGYNSVWKSSNPLILYTGPISVFFGSHAHMKFWRRVKYYTPFIVFGFFMFKIVATPLTELFWMLDETDIYSALLFALIFEIFVYANFCGLSLMIYGVLGVLGFKIPLNFRQPFSASNVIDFWKGWHVSLSIVLKELFYKKTKPKLGTVGAVFLVFIASALWHGVTLNFVLWGLFHGAMFALTLALLKRGRLFISAFVMFFAIIYGRMLFADSNTSRLLEKITVDLSHDWGVIERFLGAPLPALAALIFGVVLIVIEFVFRNTKTVKKRNYKFIRVPFAQLIIIGLTVLLITSSIGVDYAVYGQR